MSMVPSHGYGSKARHLEEVAKGVKFTGWDKPQQIWMGAKGTRMRTHTKGLDRLALTDPTGVIPRHASAARLMQMGRKAQQGSYPKASPQTSRGRAARVDLRWGEPLEKRDFRDEHGEKALVAMLATKGDQYHQMVKDGRLRRRAKTSINSVLQRQREVRAMRSAPKPTFTPKLERGYDGSMYDPKDEAAYSRANRKDPELKKLKRLERQMKREKVNKGLYTRAGARYTTSISRAADKVAPLKTGGRVARVRSSAAGGLRTMSTDATLPLRPIEELAKALKTTMSDHEAKQYAGKYGLKGPLPKTLDRTERMKAYEGRFLASGGRKAQKWERVADGADKVRNGALAVGTGAASLALASRTKAGAKVIARLPKAKKVAHPKRVENYALGTAAVGGGAELTAGHARRKRSSYSGSPGGVAASALRRMQDYTPEP